MAGSKAPNKKPITTNINLDAIPQELRECAQWVLWRAEERNGKTTKVPYKASGRGHAKADDPKTWSSFAVAVGARLRLGVSYGLGFVFSKEDPYVGIDLDGCRDSETGAIEPWALATIKSLASYTEVSPSGRGLHVIAKAELPPGGRRKGPIEMYEEGRYFTMSGARLEEMPETVELRQLEVERLHAETFSKSQAAKDSLSLDDEQLLEKARKNRAKFEALWAGSLNGHASQSEADLALCGKLASLTKGDATRIDRLFRRSGLMRAKWDQNSGGGRSYGARTIAKALEGLSTGTTGTRRSSRSMKRPEMQETLTTPYRLTEGGNADRFGDKHHEDIRYVSDLGAWFVWDGKRWARDKLSCVERFGRELVLDLYRDTAVEQDEEVRKIISRHAARSDRYRAVQNTIALSGADSRIAERAEAFDQDIWLLNVENGTLELRTGTLQQHRREDMITRLAPVSYDAKAACPRWLAFLERIFDKNADLIGFVQRALGYSLTGDTSERVLFVLLGQGRNGKSKLLEAFRAVLGGSEDGGYALRTPTETLMARRGVTIPNDIARLKGSRFVTASETEEDAHLAESVIKDMTGEDTISARFMRAEWFDFKPSHKIWLATNHRPVIRGTDHGIWDRIRLIPFNVRIPEEEQDKQLGEKLRTERSGILTWAVEGLKKWLEGGLGVPRDVLHATASYRAEMDFLDPFLADCCIESGTATVGIKELYDAYLSWCDANGDIAVGKKQFGARIRERGFVPQKRAKGKRFWGGISLVK